MSSDPTDYGHLGHRYQVLVKNNTTGSEIVADRVQSIEPTLTSNLEKAFELGNVDPVGTATDPTEYRVVLEENLHNSELELLLAGKSPLGDTSFNLGDFLTNLDNYIYLLIRGNDDTILNELEYGSGALAELAWRFVQGGACTTTLTLNCKSGKLYTSGSLVHDSWGGLDTVSPGIIKGKDARLYLGGTTDPTHKVFRLQSFTLRATFPIQVVRELGNRTIVGYVIDTPDANLDFDLLDADHQPADVLTQLTTGYYDFGDLQEVDAAIRLYDPDLAQEAGNIVRAWKMENLRVATATVKRAQVRGLATQRYSMPIGKADTAGSAGVLCYVGDIT